MQTDRTLLLVDGMAVLYRAFYAIRELSTSSGRPTNAVFGFIRMWRQMKDAWRASHALVAFDGGLPEARLGLAADYKAQRPPMPEPLRRQVATVQEYLDCAGIAWVQREREEADDVLAALCQQAAGTCLVLIATSDKDLYQLVGPNVKIVPIAGKPEVVGPAEVESRTGVAPSQIVDWLALTGDQVDNIQGVPGVGPKTAAKLIRTYGSVEALWLRLAELDNEKLKNALIEHRSLVERNLKMVRLNAAVDCQLDWERLRLRSPDVARLSLFLEEMEFHTMIREMREPDLFAR